MKKCPKCGALNKPENKACYSCFTPLEDVPAAQPIGLKEAPDIQTPKSQAPPPPAQSTPPQPASAPPYPQIQGQPITNKGVLGGMQLGEHDEHGEPIAEVGKPLGAQQEDPRMPSGIYQPAPPPVMSPRAYRGGPPQNVEFTKPVKSNNIASIFTTLLTLIVVLGGGYYIVNRFYLLPQKPITAVRGFIDSVQRRDVEGVRASLTSGSQWIVDKAPIYLFVFGSQTQGFDYEQQYVLKIKEVNNERATVLIYPGPVPIDEFKPETLPPQFSEGYPITVVAENGKWKVDLANTLSSIYGAQFKGQAGKIAR